ncbi:MAG TPA: DUF6600 domain-containing protein [Chthoniobacterales bacterium]|nr:DUF6600 domain-containing protein [Chthoniobacterales bacterium]
MKRTLLALTLVGLLLPLAPRTEAATEVSLNLFYDNLSPYGSWIDVADYGYCFQPSVAVSNSDWRPYADGYWAYTDAGWTWVSYEDFGWATYHYGRWADLDSYGWVWVPGYEWGPAWVSWRTGGDYVGWAPLPPQPGGVVYEGRAITGAIDASFDIGPLYYNFVDIRYIGEPVLRGRIIEPRRNVTIINRTMNVTNITYNNSMVVNHGPDINRINQYSTRPVQRLTLQRETTISGESGRRGNLNRVSGNALVVAAPAVQKSNEKLAPKQVKAKVEKPRIERGWKGVENRKQVEEAMRKENAQNVPPPSFQPQKGRQGQGAQAQPNEAGQVAPEETKQQSAQDQRRQRAEKRQAQQQQQQQQGEQAQQKEENAKPEQMPKRAEERDAQQESRKQQREEAQQEKEQRPAQGADEEQKSRQTEKAQGRRNQQADQEQAQRQQKAQREERRQKEDRSANDRPQRAERASQAEQPSRAEKSQRQERAQEPQRARQTEESRRAERPEQARQARPERQKAEVRKQQDQQGQGNQQSDEERKGKKKKRADEAPPQP